MLFLLRTRKENQELQDDNAVMLDVATKDGRFSVVVEMVVAVVAEMVVAVVAETAVAVVAETAVAVVVETAGIDYTIALKPYRYR